MISDADTLAIFETFIDTVGVSPGWLALAQDPALTRLYLANEDNWDELTEVEKAQLTYVWIASFRSYETILLQVEEGLLDQDAMDRLGWGEAFDPGFQVQMLWPDIAGNLNPHIREHLEAWGLYRMP